MINWTVQYEANELPRDATPEWDRYYRDAGLGSTESVSSGILTLVSDHTVNPSAWIYYLTGNGSLSDSLGYTIKARLKMNSFSSEEGDGNYWHGLPYSTYFDFWDDVGYGAVLIGDGKATLYYDSSFSEYAMDPSDGYHIYHAVVKDGVATLYIDGAERIQLDSVTPEGGSPLYDVTFGNWFSVIGGQPERTGTNSSGWDYVYCHIDRALTPTIIYKPRIIEILDKSTEGGDATLY